MKKNSSEPDDLFQAIFDNANDAIIVSNLNGQILDANPIACEKLGYYEEELRELDFKDICSPEYAETIVENVVGIKDKSELVLNCHHLSKNGTSFPIEVKIKLIEYKAKPAILYFIRDLSEMKYAETEIEDARIAAEVANRARSEFLATMSHELRTPLNSIIGFSDLLSEGDIGYLDEKQSKYVGNILKSGKHLLDLINDILDLSKVEAGKVKLSPEVFDVKTAFNEVTTVASPLATKNKIDFSVDSQNSGTIFADKGKFKQTLYNLLNNAIKFTPEGGSVKLTSEKDDNELRVSVEDTGIGIMPDDQKKLFRPFTQLDSSARRQYEGTGLGLTLVKKFVELHDGKVTVHSEVGKGSTFTFTIPIAQSQDETLSKKPEASKPSISTISKKRAVNNSTILVAEDETDARELLTTTLHSLGYEVVEVDRGDKVLETAKRTKPFAITTDIMMPGMNGWQVLNKLKEDEETKDIPVIMISVLDKCYQNKTVDAEDYFVKPVEREELLETLNKFKKRDLSGNSQILVIDDNPDERELIASILNPEGYEIIEAEGGKDGIELAKKEHPELITLDLMMPGVNGFDVIECLKKDSSTANIPIIVCTAKELTSENCKMLKENVTFVMTKGAFNRRKLLDLVKELSSLHIA